MDLRIARGNKLLSNVLERLSPVHQRTRALELLLLSEVDYLTSCLAFAPSVLKRDQCCLAQLPVR